MIFRRLRFFTSASDRIDSNAARKKIKYLASKRGIVENEIILENFLNKHFDNLSEPDLALFNDLLHEYDWDIFAWITEQRKAPEKYSNSKLLELLKESLMKK